MRILTASGPAEAEIDEPAAPRFLLAITHGAGGGAGSSDLLAVRDAAAGLGGVVARVLQPYRVRGARAPGSVPRQDADWLEVVSALRDCYPGLPLLQGGRSNGARLACRTAVAAGVKAVIALAFPLHPPGRPERSRAGELRGAGVPVLVISGSRDPFGVPARADADRVIVLAGQGHALSGGAAVITAEVSDWLPGFVTAAAQAPAG
jgi:uncharacterized protein